MPENLLNQKVRWNARTVIGGLITAFVIGGAGYSMAEFNSAGKPSPSVTVVAEEAVYAFVAGTGSTTIKYPAVCIPNPLASLSPSQGTGIVMRVQYEGGNNPAGVGGDIGFVKSCGNAGGSGNTLIDNVCTSTGCVSTYTTGTALWNGADFIKFTPRANLTSGYTGRIKVWYGDVFGE
jgi:hypothetical protein